MQIRLEQILICRYKRKIAAIQPHKYKIIMISGGLIRIDYSTLVIRASIH